MIQAHGRPEAHLKNTKNKLASTRPTNTLTTTVAVRNQPILSLKLKSLGNQSNKK